MNIAVKGSTEEEIQMLKDVQAIIQQQMEERLKDLGILKKEIIDNRRYLFEEVPIQLQQLVDQEGPVREHYYTETYNRVLELSRMYYNPYFGMIDFIDHALEDEESCYYIGKRGLTKEGEPVILDWRTPAASLFYQQRLGQMSFRAPGGQHQVDLLHRRQYIIKNGVFKGMFDSELNIQDEILQMVLSGSSGTRLKEIIATIQKDQDDVIREPLDTNVILNGVAGCGKTTIVLHRIAYLLYNYRQQLTNNILIIGPNELFMDYISNVLPDLGETDNSFQFTVKELATRLVRPKRSCMKTRDYYERMLTGRDKSFLKDAQYKSSLDFKNDLDKAFKEFEEKQAATEDFVFQGNVIMSAEERNQMFFKTQLRLPYIRRCEKIKRTIRARLRDLRNDVLRRLRTYYKEQIIAAKKKGDYYRVNALQLELAENVHKYFIEVYEQIQKVRDLYIIPDAEEWYAEASHAGKDRNKSLVRGSKADCPGWDRHIRLRIFEDLFDLRRHFCQSTAFDRFHDGDIHTVFAGYFIALSGLNALALPVGIVDLQLNEFSFRMLGQDLVKHFGTVMEREADMFGQAFFLLFGSKSETVGFLDLRIAVFVKSMQKDKVKIACLRPLQHRIKQRLIFLSGLQLEDRDLIGQLERLAGVAFYNALADRCFRTAPIIYISCVKICETGCHKFIHHLFCGFQIIGAVC